MRSLLLLLLSLTIPLQGFAAAHAFESPCPMHDGLPVSGTDDGMRSHDCCKDHLQDTGTQRSDLCKAGTQCQSASPVMLSLAVHAAAPVCRPMRAVASKREPPASPLIGVWRPPTIS